MAIPIIDLFAGPGGLGEGFSSLHNATENNFEVALSIEKDTNAHNTLKLRHFFRAFTKVPNEYYKFLSGQLTLQDLYNMYPKEAGLAEARSWLCTLGEERHENVYSRIKKELGKQKLWVLVGGPPCQAYSLVGRSRRANDEKFEEDHKHFLYREYLKIIADHQPPVFVMENVKGLLSATHGGKSMVNTIMSDLSDPHASLGQGKGKKYKLYSLSTGKSYQDGASPSEFLVKAEEYGVPQARHRLLILGIRDDISVKPRVLTPAKAPIVADLIDDMPPLRSSISRGSEEGWLDAVIEYAQNMSLDLEFKDLPVSSAKPTKPKALRAWLHDERLTAITGHEARSHMKADLARYLFAAQRASQTGRSPKMAEFPTELLPKHKNVSKAVEGKMFSDRFRVQLADKPSTTVTSHISKDGHYFIHYDPLQCRSLTVREAARLQTFPDNYHFLGNRTAQYHQVGNAVPPYLAKQIGEVVQDIFERMESGGRLNS